MEELTSEARKIKNLLSGLGKNTEELKNTHKTNTSKN